MPSDKKIEERMAELDARKAKIEGEMKRLLAHKNENKRKADTRRKILAGAMIFAKVASGGKELSQEKFLGWMDEYLTAERDRALFDLPLNGSAKAPTKSKK